MVDILASTRGRSMCMWDNDPPKEGEFVISPSIRVQSGGLEKSFRMRMSKWKVRDTGKVVLNVLNI